MLQQQKVTIKPTPGGAVFINEQGEETPYIGRSVMVEIGGILEMVADCGREVVILYEVDLPDDWIAAVEAGYEAGEEPDYCAICEQEITPGQPMREYEKRPGFFYVHSDCGLPWS